MKPQIMIKRLRSRQRNLKAGARASGIVDALDDRIEIYSPGGMVSGISLEGKDLLEIPSKRRNPISADIFSRLKYMERTDGGFKII